MLVLAHRVKKEVLSSITGGTQVIIVGMGIEVMEGISRVAGEPTLGL